MRLLPTSPVTLKASFALCLCSCTWPAHADWGGTLSVQSELRYRGISYSGRAPQGQLTLALDEPSGWYGGASLTRARFDDEHQSPWWQTYLGRVVNLATDLDVEAGLSMNHFTAIRRYDYAEVYLGLLGQRWNARLYGANDYYGRQQHSLYGELNLNRPLSSLVQAVAHFGLIRGWGGGYRIPQGPVRLDWRVGAAWRQGIGEVQLAWVAAGRGGPSTWADDAQRPALVLGLSAAF